MFIHKWFKKSSALILMICLLISAMPFTTASAAPVKKFTPDSAWNLLVKDGILEKISMGSKKFEDKLHSVIYEGKTAIGKYSFKAGDTLQCYGYAKTAMQALLKTQQPGQGKKTEDMSGLRGSATVSYSLFQSLGIPQRGAMLIRTASNEKKTKDGVTYYDWAKADGGEGHSMIMLYYNENFIYTIEGNAEGGRNVLFKRTWAEFNNNQLTRKSKNDPRLIKYAVYVSDAAFKKIYDDTKTSVDPKSIKISGPDSVEKGKTIQLTVAVEPKDASQEVSWSTSDKKIATVNDKGTVTGKSAGTVTITATSKAKGSIKASIKITVSDHPDESIPIDEKHFPDKLFREYVKGFDKNKDGRFSKDELRSVKKIYHNRGNEPAEEILDLKGIEYFTELTYLSIRRHSIVEVDLSKNLKLEEIEFVCRLKRLDVSKNKKLKVLICDQNKIKELILGKQDYLGKLILTENSGNLKKLDISKCKLLCDLVKTKERTGAFPIYIWGEPSTEDIAIVIDTNIKLITK